LRKAYIDGSVLEDPAIKAQLDDHARELVQRVVKQQNSVISELFKLMEEAAVILGF
jgi:hypothetical protein